jgi:DNA-directed RNA polymerase
MANFIHSLDAANIHLLVNIIKRERGLNKRLNLYTIHDCFASTNNEMTLVEKYVKSAFALLYFKKSYLNELHNSLIAQIKSYADLNIVRKEDGVTICNLVMGSESWEVEVPDVPDKKWNENKKYLREQIMISEYFIS